MNTKVPTERRLNTIRGKNLVGAATQGDVNMLFAYIDLLEDKLDESDDNDTFGTEGWRRYFGLASD